MLDLRTCAALPHVGGVVPLLFTSAVLVARLLGVTTGVTPAAPLHSGKSRLSLHLCSCRAARLGSGAPALPVSRVLAGLRLVDPPWISCSVGERAPHRYLRLSTKPAAGAGSCVKPQRRGRGVDSRDLDPALGNLQWPCASL